GSLRGEPVTFANAGAASSPRPPLEREGSLTGLVATSRLGESATQPQWFAVYTRANHEKRVAEQLANRDIAHFLPLYDTMSRWKDRRVLVHRPLFAGYLFVHLEVRNRLQVQQVPGVVGLVGFNGAPTAIPDAEITRVRELLGSGLHAEPHPFLTAGRRVRVKRGPLTGLEGILLRRKSGLRFVVSIELIQRSMAVEIDEADLEPVSTQVARA